MSDNFSPILIPKVPSYTCFQIFFLLIIVDWEKKSKFTSTQNSIFCPLFTAFHRSCWFYLRVT